MSTRSSRNLGQACPNCAKLHDISIYVSGQLVLCSCGIRFAVHRVDVPLLSKSQVPTDNQRGSKAVDLEPTLASGNSSPQESPSQPTALPVAPEVPGYELTELLGKGGMGEVWRARQVSLSRWVAVKLLPSRFAKDSEFVARFDKEATALAALSHPGVVQIIDRGQIGEHYFFVMELVPGINLRELMNGARLSVRDALRIGAQIARAIDYAHDMKVVHRDLKPENILVDARGHVKIADFGLAGMKGSDRDIALTATAVAMGTVNYMAPEQRRDAKHVDHRADLYSLGVLLYEMLTGELPIGRFKMPSALVPSLDSQLDEMVAGLLEPDPSARPARANIVADVLESLTPRSNSSSVASLPPVVSQVALEAPRPTASAWKMSALVLGALLTVGVVLKVLPSGGETSAAAAPAWYSDSDNEEVFSTRAVDGDSLSLDFDVAADGGEELNLHCGQWKLDEGVLSAVQYGDSVSHDVLVPRTYLAKRYYSAEHFEASVDVELDALPSEFPPINLATEPHFAELAFRIHDLQVSVFAVPGEGMRLTWRYFRKDGREETGDSSQDLDSLQGDLVPVPAGKFRLKLRLNAMKGGDVNAEAFVNSTRITRQVLPGLAFHVGKVALGCRNQQCRFDNLAVAGHPASRPTPRSN
jgi:serine/threonine protein kinase